MGHRSCSARCCASVIRPPRITNERMERGVFDLAQGFLRCSKERLRRFRRAPGHACKRRDWRFAKSGGRCADRSGSWAGPALSIQRCRRPCAQPAALARDVAGQRSGNVHRPRMKTRPGVIHRAATGSRRRWTGGTTMHRGIRSAAYSAGSRTSTRRNTSGVEQLFDLFGVVFSYLVGSCVRHGRKCTSTARVRRYRIRIRASAVSEAMDTGKPARPRSGRTTMRGPARSSEPT